MPQQFDLLKASAVTQIQSDLEAAVAASASQAKLAALAVGAPIVTSLPSPVPANGSIVLLQDPDFPSVTTVHEVRDGVWEFIGALGWAITPRHYGASLDPTVDSRSAIVAALAANGYAFIDREYGVSAPIELTDGQKVFGLTEQVSKLTSTEIDSAWGLREGILTLVGEGCGVENLSLDGRRTNTTTFVGGRSSGIYLRSTSSNARVRNVTALHFTRHSFCILGQGHILENITGGDACADPLAFGSGEEAPFVRDCHVRGYTSIIGSHQRGIFEFDDGSVDCSLSGVRASGFYQSPYMSVSDHGRDGENNARCTVRDVEIHVATRPPRGTRLIEIVSGSGLTARDIVFEDITVTGYGLPVVYIVEGDVVGVRLRRIKMSGIRVLGAFANSSSVFVEDVIAEDCDLEFDFDHWITAVDDTGSGLRLRRAIGCGLVNSRITNCFSSVLRVETNSDDVIFSGNSVLNPCRDASGTPAVNFTVSNTAPFGLGLKTVNDNKIIDELGNMSAAVATQLVFTNQFITRNLFKGYTGANAISESGSLAANKVWDQNIEIPAS